MTADIENLIFEGLRRIDGPLGLIQNDIREAKERLGHLERGQPPEWIGSICVCKRIERPL